MQALGGDILVVKDGKNLFAWLFRFPQKASAE
jgi:hypothetical protein